MTDYQVEFLFRDITEEEAIKKAGEIHDFLFLSDPSSEFEMFVMEVYIDEFSHGMNSVHHWPEDAKGPFRDIVWDEDGE